MEKACWNCSKYIPGGHCKEKSNEERLPPYAEIDEWECCDKYEYDGFSKDELDT